MRQNGLRGVVRGKKLRTTIAGDEADRPVDLVDRKFVAAAPNVLWVADFTYVMTFSGTVYVAFIIDVFSRRIVGWKADTSMKTALVLDTLEMALWTRDRDGLPVAPGLIHHHDRGSQLGLKESSQHRVLGGYTVEPRAGRAAVRPRRVARRASRSGRTTTRWCPGEPGGGPSRCRSWPEIELRLLRRGVRRGPRPGCAIRASCGAGC